MAGSALTFLERLMLHDAVRRFELLRLVALVAQSAPFSGRLQRPIRIRRIVTFRTTLGCGKWMQGGFQQLTLYRGMRIMALSAIRILDRETAVSGLEIRLFG